MKSTVERTPESEAVLTDTLEWGEIEKAADRAFKQLAQKYTVPGFRKGHAPRSMIERMLGKDTIYHEGLEDLVESSYREALREHDITPVAQPTVDAPPLEQGESYTYTARVPILVPPTLGDYRAIRVAPPSTEVGEEEVEHALEHMQEDAAEWRPVERAAQVGDQVTTSLKLTVEDKVVSNYADTDFELAIERPGIFAGLDDHLVGMREGQSAEFETAIPEDYANPALAGKTGHYEVSIKAVKERVLPELDDEFAKTVGDAETLEGLRGTLREQLEGQKRAEARRELREQVAKAVTEQAEVVVHPAMVSDEVDAMLRETDRVLGQNRLTLQHYLQIMGKSEDEYRAEIEPEARERVQRDLVLAAVADAEGIEVTDKDLADWLKMLNALGGKPLRLQDLSVAQRASIRGRMRRDRALDRMIEIATEGKGIGEVETKAEGEGEAESSAPPTPASATAAGAAGPGEPSGAGVLANPELEQTLVRGAQEAAQLGAKLGADTPAVGAARAVEQRADAVEAVEASQGRPQAERQPESRTESQPEGAQTPKSSETQALSGSGTEVPKSGA